MPPIPVRRSSGVALGQGRGGGSSAALVSAWLPKRIRIELIADSRATSCIFHGRLEARRRSGERRRSRLYRTPVRRSRSLPAGRLFLICAPSRQDPSLFRKESSAACPAEVRVGFADCAMRGNHLGFLSKTGP